MNKQEEITEAVRNLSKALIRLGEAVEEMADRNGKLMDTLEVYFFGEKEKE